MKSIIFIVMVCGATWVKAQQVGSAGRTYSMVLASSSFDDGGEMAVRFTQAESGPTGAGLSPQLSWDNIPPNTQSYVLYMHDMDVARNRSINDNPHWIVWGIPSSTTSLPEGLPSSPELPDGSRQMSSAGPVYRGPGAPAGGPMHHYAFEIYALDVILDVAPAENLDDTLMNVWDAMQGHVLSKGVLIGKFKRPN